MAGMRDVEAYAQTLALADATAKAAARGATAEHNETGQDEAADAPAAAAEGDENKEPSSTSAKKSTAKKKDSKSSKEKAAIGMRPITSFFNKAPAPAETVDAEMA